MVPARSFMQLLQVATTHEFGCLAKLEPDVTYALRLYEALTGQIEKIVDSLRMDPIC